MTTNATLIDGFLRSCERFPTRTALEVADQTLSYAELRDQAVAIASLLAEAELGGPPLCAVYAYRSRAAYVGILAALYSGRGYVPLNRTFPVDRTRYMLERSGSSAVVVDDDTIQQMYDVLDGIDRTLLIIAPDTADIERLRRDLPRHAFAGPDELASARPIDPVAVDPESIAYVLFTSGSTGTPKGVGVTQGNVRAFLDYNVALYDVGPDDRLSQLFDLTFDLSVFDLFLAWESGACVCVPADLNRSDRFVKDAGLTIWFSVPSQAIVMQRLGMLKPASFPTLRLSLFCGEALPDEIAAAWSRAAPNSTVENLYGPTELTIACTRYRWEPESTREAHLGIVPIGWPYPDMDVLVVDDDLEEVDVGEAGELIATGPQMTPGYWDNPERTEERYVTPPGKRRRYYRTGDRVMQPRADGPLLYLGRVDNQIKVRGHRVELGEIEAVLREESQTQGVVAVGWPRTAAGVAAVEAFLETTPATVEIAALLDRVRRRLPSYMVPRRIHVLERLPLNANGKYDRSKLETMLDESST